MKSGGIYLFKTLIETMYSSALKFGKALLSSSISLNSPITFTPLFNCFNAYNLLFDDVSKSPTQDVRDLRPKSACVGFRPSRTPSKGPLSELFNSISSALVKQKKREKKIEKKIK